MDVAALRYESRITLGHFVEDEKSEESECVHPHIVSEDAGGYEVHHCREVEPELGGNHYPKYGRILVGKHWQIYPTERIPQISHIQPYQLSSDNP